MAPGGDSSWPRSAGRVVETTAGAPSSGGGDAGSIADPPACAWTEIGRGEDRLLPDLDEKLAREGLPMLTCGTSPEIARSFSEGPDLDDRLVMEGLTMLTCGTSPENARSLCSVSEVESKRVLAEGSGSAVCRLGGHRASRAVCGAVETCSEPWRTRDRMWAPCSDALAALPTGPASSPAGLKGSIVTVVTESGCCCGLERL